MRATSGPIKRWAPPGLRGQQKQVSTYGYHASVAISGAVDTRGGTVTVQQAGDLTAQTFQGFVEHLFAR